MSSASLVAALIAAPILAVIGLVHVYWGLGGRLAQGAALPERDGKPLFQPSTAGTLAVAAALFAAAVLIAIRSGAVVLPALDPVAGIACWALAVAFVARAVGDFRYVGFFKRVTGSRFARLDSAVFAPLCLGLGVLAAIVAAS